MTDQNSSNLKQISFATLLGEKGTDEDQLEFFLQKTDSLIWDDFVENHVLPKLDEAEREDIDNLLMKESATEEEKRKQVLSMLERVLPDYQQVLDKIEAKLKQDMFDARLEGSQKRFADDPDKLSQVEEAKRLAQADDYQQAAEILNQLS